MKYTQEKAVLLYLHRDQTSCKLSLLSKCSIQRRSFIKQSTLNFEWRNEWKHDIPIIRKAALTSRHSIFLLIGKRIILRLILHTFNHFRSIITQMDVLWYLFALSSGFTSAILVIMSSKVLEEEQYNGFKIYQ